MFMNNDRNFDAKMATELAALAAMSDADIDTSDIPEVDERFWAEAVRGRFYKPKEPLDGA
mgnify:CR=1 FL=1|tara:strand:- start:1566 stop:1745 length:180 start_codon:yes stop_codon:yes gene_type:complete